MPKLDYFCLYTLYSSCVPCFLAIAIVFLASLLFDLYSTLSISKIVFCDLLKASFFSLRTFLTSSFHHHESLCFFLPGFVLPNVSSLAFLKVSFSFCQRSQYAVLARRGLYWVIKGPHVTRF